ncbi:MAG: glycosyltransferase family 4 protein, partial [Methylobacteriaceae bacterium]|nr:glycosyltransferase family 4 protein [Methylobacteriaceae bacterium]
MPGLMAPLPRHVLMTADAVGGVWTYALDLARGLAGADVTVTLAMLGPSPGDEARREALAVPDLDLVETTLPLDWLAATPGEVLESGREIARLAQTGDVDLVHLNSPALAAGGAFDRPVVGICHSCVATWWDALRGGTTLPEDFGWRTDLLGRGYRACDLLLAPTAAFAEATADRYAVPVPRAVPNGRDLAGEPGESCAPFVFTAGRLWDEAKGFATLDAAAAALPAPVLAAGPTRAPHGGEISAGHATPLGSLANHEVLAYLTDRPIFASLARYEPFGLAVLEAARAGCPLVLSNIATFRELWDGAALFVPPDDAPVLASVLTGLLDDEAGRRRWGDAARARSALYTGERMVEGV